MSSWLIVGCGFTGLALVEELRRDPDVLEIHATIRDESQRSVLESKGVCVWHRAVLDAAWFANVLNRAGEQKPLRVVVCVPPAAGVDDAIVRELANARVERIAYVSSTAVYGNRRGWIDAKTEVSSDDERARVRIEAEKKYRELGAVIVRAAGIYGPGRGMHVRLARGTFSLSEDGNQVVSRVHVEDLAAVLIAACERGEAGEAFPMADNTPVPHREAVGWLCEVMKLQLPKSISLHEAHATLRHDRSVNNARARELLGRELKYPSYREGFAHCLECEAR